MKVKFKKLSEDAILPKKATEGAAAYDVYVPRDIIVFPERSIIPIDIAVEIPKCYEIKIEPRSGFSSKGMEGHVVLQCKKNDIVEKFALKRGFTKIHYNGFEYWKQDYTERFDADVIVGKIDSDYRGCVGVIVRSNERFMINAGTRIAQATLYKVEDIEFEEVQELTNTDRGGGGYRSTGA